MTYTDFNDRELMNALRYIEAHPDDPEPYNDVLTMVYEHTRNGEGKYHKFNRWFRNEITGAMRRLGGGDLHVLDRLNMAYRKSLLIDAKVDFDAYMLYIELDREAKKRFYLPRRSKLLPVVQTLQDLEDDKLDIAGISLPPGTGKSGTAIFYLSWLAGKYPDEQILTGSHSNAFVGGVYDECLRILDKNGEYLWHDVFPDLSVSDTNAKGLRIDIGKRNRFETLEFTSIGTGNAGLYRATRLLYCDDLVSGIEVALSRERLNKLWETYTTDLRQRKQGDHCKELHIATRWSVHDIIGRLQAQYENSDRARFIVIPALNDKDESNFDYVGGVGFSTAFYHEQRDIMDDASWRALYMNEPIEREGQLYHPDELRRFFDLPEKEPDGIVAVCDTKAKGNDYAFMPIMYLYGQDIYMADCICDNGDPGIVEERLAQCLYKHKVQECQFESNSAGWHIAEKVRDRVAKLGWHTHVTTKPTTTNKETKIIVNAPEVKRRFLFLDSTKYKANSDYGKAMAMLTGYTLVGKNAHDDVPDGLAMAILYMNSKISSSVEVFQRPF